MSLRTFLTEPRSMHRAFAVALGAFMVIAGLGLGVQHQFNNWPVTAFVCTVGLALVLAGRLLSEAKLQWLFTIALLLNITDAALALLSP